MIRERSPRSDHPGSRTTSSLLVGLLVALALPAAARPDDGGRSLHWRRVDVQARLDAAGDLHVTERQAMVFTGPWNGGERGFRPRPGQTLRFERLSRELPDGSIQPLVEGSLDERDRWRLRDRVLRWRARLPSDPPFQDTERVYVLEYTLTRAVVDQGDGRFRLDHELAFAERPGPILALEARLELDPAWQADGPTPIAVRAARPLAPPSEGLVLHVPLRWVGAGEAPGAGLRGPARRGLLAGLAGVLVVAVGLVGWRAARSGLFAPLAPRAAVDPAWLGEHLFFLRPEAAGLAWHGRAGAPEVGALIARMTAEGKLETSVLPGAKGKPPELQLVRKASRQELDGREWKLVNALFVGEGKTIDTRRLRQHYRRRGFDPGALIQPELEEEVSRHAPEFDRGGRSSLPLVAALLLAMVTVFVGANAPGEEEPAWVLAAGLGAWAVLFPVAAVAAHRFATRASGQAGYAAAALALPAAFAGAIGWFAHGGAGAGIGIVATGVAAWLATVLLLCRLAWVHTSRYRIALRKQLAAARDFFEAELLSPAPRLEDRWAPYLIALGLGPELDRWFGDHRGAAATSGASLGEAGSTAEGGRWGSSGGGAPSWTGGGGAFSGGGASGTWAALGGFSGSIASFAPSSSSSGSSGSSWSSSSSDSGSSSSSSGGGSGGGW